MTALAEPRRTEVLVIDDDHWTRDVLSRLLESDGLHALPARGAVEALDLYRRHRDAVCLVLMDLRLPGPDGCLALRMLRGIDPDVPCCLVSGVVAAGEEEEFLREGFNAVVRKPFRMSDVTGVVHSLLRGRQECLTGLTKGQAEDLLDWLAGNGYPPGELDVEENGLFTVRYQRRAPLPHPPPPA